MSFVHRVDELVQEHGNALVGKADHWERVPLGAIARVINGFPFPSNGFNSSEGEPVIRIRDITAGQIGTYFKGQADGAPRVDHGDLVIGMDGDFNCRLWPGESALMNQRVCKVSLEEAYYSKQFLAYALPAYLKLVNEYTSAITVKHLSSSTVNDLPLPLPPRAEQDRLVSKLDELFSRIEEGERALERVEKLVERYRQSVLKAAVSGELTRDWREKNKGRLECGEALLARILKARREAWEKAELDKMKAKGITPANDKWKQKYEEPAPPDTADLPELPIGWTWASADQLTNVITDGEHATPERTTVGVPLLSARNVRDGFLSLKDIDFISPETHASLQRRLRVVAGDVLLSCSGSVGRSCVVPQDIDFSLVRSVAVLKPTIPIGCYMSLALRSLLLQNQISRRKSQTAQANIFQGAIKKLAFPLASIFEIERMVDVIDRQFSVSDEICRTLEVAAREADGARQSVLKKAFCGALLNQCPDEETASALLQRIAIERGAASAKRKRGPKNNSKAPA